MGWHIATCKTCGGSGAIPGKGPPDPKKNPPHMPNFVPRDPCPTCSGSGEVLEED